MQSQQQRITDYFPLPPARTPDTTVYIFGCQVLAYILSQDGEVYGLLSDQDLQDAHYAAKYALIAREISVLAVEKITTVQMTITAVLERRARQDETAALQEAARTSSQGSPSHDIPGGTRVPTHPRPPAPPMPDALALPTAPRKPEFQF